MLWYLGSVRVAEFCLKLEWVSCPDEMLKFLVDKSEDSTSN